MTSTPSDFEATATDVARFLNLAEAARVEMYRANAAEPYDHSIYEAASSLLEFNLSEAINVAGFPRPLCGHLSDYALEMVHDSGESVHWIVGRILADLSPRLALAAGLELAKGDV
jgi:hypothetical protein